MFIIRFTVPVAPSRGRDRSVVLYVDRGACGAPSKSDAVTFSTAPEASRYARILQNERIIGRGWTVVLHAG